MLYTIVLAYLAIVGKASNAYLYPFADVEPNEVEGLTQLQLSQLIKYNLGLAEHQQQEQQKAFEQMIKSFGKGNMMAPTDMSYLIAIQSEKLFASQETKQARITEGYTATMTVSDRQQKSILDVLFADNEHSLVNRASRLYRDSNLPFVVYQNEDDLDVNFLQWTVTLYLGKNNEVYFYEPARDKSYKMETSLEKCVDFFFGTTFDYAPKDGKVYKYNTNELIEITPENQDLFLAFFKDICAMNKLSQIFKKGIIANYLGNTPNFLAIVNKSISKLESVLPESDIELVYDMMRVAHKKLSKNLKNYFDADDLFGMILVEEEKNPQLTTTKESAKVQRILMETRNRMLDQTSAQTLSASSVMAPGTFQIYAWTGIFFTILLIGILYAMFTMEITKDTLLYAKFLTTDQKN